MMAAVLPPLPAGMYDELEAALKPFRDGSRSLIVTMRAIRSIGKKYRVSYMMKLKLEQVGFSIKNRDSYGLTPKRCSDVVNGVATVGYDPSLVNGIVHDVKPTDMETYERANALESEKSNGFLAPVIPGTLKFFTLAASHFSQGGRLVIFKMKTETEVIASGGKFDMDALRQKDPAFARDLEEGIDYEFWPWWVFEHFPEIATVLQSGANASQTLAGEEPELQGFRKMHQLYTEQLKAKGSCSLKDITREIVASNPVYKDKLQNMFGYYLKFGGSGGYDTLEEIEGVAKRQKHVRTLSNELYFALQEDWKGRHQCPKIRAACFKLYLAHELEKAINPGDIRRLGSKDAIVSTKDAERLVSEVRGLVGHITDQKIRIAMDMFEMNVVCALLRKKPPGGITLKSPEHAAAIFMDEVSEITKKPLLSDAWVSFKPDASEEKKKEKKDDKDKKDEKVILKRQYDSDGNLTDGSTIMLRGAGFEIGNSFTHTKMKRQGTIQSIDDDGMVVCDVAGQEIKVQVSEFQSGEFARLDGSNRAEKYAEVFAYRTIVSTDWKNAVVKAGALLELEKLSKKHDKFLQRHVRVMVEPKKTVYAACDIPKDELVLVPTTPNVVCKKVTEGHQVSMFKVTPPPFTFNHSKFEFSLATCNNLTKDAAKEKDIVVCPFFLIKTTDRVS